MKELTSVVSRNAKPVVGYSHMMNVLLAKKSVYSQEKLLNDLKAEGYGYIPSTSYTEVLAKPFVKLETTKIQETYEELDKDTAPTGNRYRAYTKYNLNLNSGEFVVDRNNGYKQELTYDPDFGGTIRQYKMISSAFLENPLVDNLIKFDVDVAKKSGIVNFNEPLEMGLHQIRYAATPKSPSFSSPMPLHKDDEPLVFVHLFNVTKNLVGGSNVLAPNPGKAVDVVQLEKPFESLALTHKLFHSVTPMGTKNEKTAFRDILLVTFFNRKKPLTASEGKPAVRERSMVERKL